jgi:hypothetical protein
VCNPENDKCYARLQAMFSGPIFVTLNQAALSNLVMMLAQSSNMFSNVDRLAITRKNR